MAAHHHRQALWLLLPANTVALASALAVTQGAVTLSPPRAAVSAAPASAPAGLVMPLTVARQAETQAPAPVAAPSTASASPVPVATAAKPAVPAPSRPLKATAVTRPTRQTFRSDLDRQIARIPLYKSQLVRWVVVPDLAVYGVTSLRTRTVYVSPRIPRKLLYSVVAHEWGHIVSTHAYGGNLRASQQAFKNWFGGGSMGAATERAADCIAVLLGATWTHYTSCRNERWRLGALYLANGMKLPAE